MPALVRGIAVVADLVAADLTVVAVVVPLVVVVAELVVRGGGEPLWNLQRDA